MVHQSEKFNDAFAISSKRVNLQMPRDMYMGNLEKRTDVTA